MRILRVVSDLYPTVVGGIGIHAHEMSRIQSEKGNDVTVLTFAPKNSPNQENYNYQVVKVNSSFKLMGNSFSFSFPNKLWKMIDNSDIVHAHSHLFFSTVMCAFFRHFKTFPLIITNHGLFSQTVPMCAQKMYLFSVGKWTLQSADRVLCYTDIEKNQLIEYDIKEQNIEVIHNGISSVDFFPSSVQPKKQILWIGRFTTGKGVEVLLEAFQIFHSRFPDYKLFMIGEGPLKNNIQSQISETGLTDSIIQESYIPNKKLVEVYQQSALLVLPSFEEGVPRTILEAMSCGIPVVCSDLPQLREIVEGCGVLVPVRDPKALADALFMIISNSDIAKKYGINGREKIINNYSWNDTVDKTLELYTEVIQSLKKIKKSANMNEYLNTDLDTAKDGDLHR